MIGITEDSITIEWSEIATTGGAAVTAYVIEKKEGTGAWTHVASVSRDTTQYRLLHLFSTTSYYFRVAAENEEGLGRWRELDDPVTPTKPKSMLTLIGILLQEINICHEVLASYTGQV